MSASMRSRAGKSRLNDNLEFTPTQKVPQKDPLFLSSVWTPRINTVFKLLLSIRFTSAIWSNISDCDETFNYWEPAHYLLFGSGFQTWEYSPVYAIRSYAYLLLHVVPAQIIQTVISPDKIALFYLIRCLLALLCAVCETYFYRGVLKHFGAAVARLTLAFLLLSTGMYISSAAFLPSSFSMYMTLVSMAAWYQGHLPIAILGTAASAFLGWPFAAILGLPIAMDILLRRAKLRLFIAWSLLSVVAILLPAVYLDSARFGKLVVAPLNIVMYNVMTEHGPDLYGTEPWTFYFVNGFLNFNVVFLLAIPSLPAVYVVSSTTGLKFPGIPHWLTLSPMYVWMLIFFTQAHKEERFIFPIYPLICLSAALMLDTVQRLLSWVFAQKKHYTEFLSPLPLATVIGFALLSLSRIFALYNGYHAPLEVYTALHNISSDKRIHTLAANKPVTVCVGKEWYRFPSRFFLPNERWRMRFLESEFRGQLPAEFGEGADATRVIPKHMNDMNREERSRYISSDKCHYIIDLDVGTETSREPNYSRDTERWKIIHSASFLDNASSHSLYRAFYVPILSAKHCRYGNYNLLQAIHGKKKMSHKDKQLPQS